MSPPRCDGRRTAFARLRTGRMEDRIVPAPVPFNLFWTKL